ncbi:MAG: hypothetical protein AB8F94_11870 [Saprospiraceae bacterium]
MPNPYDDIFDDSGEKKKSPEPEFTPLEFEDDHFDMNGKEPLDEILESIKTFQQQAESFSKLLSQTKAIDHKVEGNILKYFLVTNDKFDQRSLGGEKKYHELLSTKFERIIAPMRELAKLHLTTIKQFNQDIDKNYFSIEKTDHAIKSEKSMAVDGINLQRRILADASSDLDILKNALEDTERRIKKYINAGGSNNISEAESVMLIQKRSGLTDGRNHQFDFSFFGLNFLDKTVISFGVHMKETSSQYLGKLMTAFEIR